MRAWLKGGLIGLGISIFLVAVSYLIKSLAFVIMFLGVWQCFIITLGKGDFLCVPLGLLLILIDGFIIGAIIGKIKSRRKQNEI